MQKGSFFANSRKAIDIETLVFNNSSHFMSNKTCKLPEHSKRIEHKGYEEVFIPGLKKPVDPSETFVYIKVSFSYLHPSPHPHFTSCF